MPTTVTIQGIGDIDFPDSMTSDQIAAAIRNDPRLRGTAQTAPAQPDTFMGESGLAGIGQLFSNVYTAATQHPASQWGSDVWNSLMGMYHGQAAETASEQAQAAQEWNKGNYSAAAAHFIAGAPVVGRPLVHGAYNTTHSNVSGLAGDLLSLLTMGAGNSVGEAAGESATTAGKALYGNALRFPKSVSLEDAATARELGYSEGIPVRGMGGIKAIGDTRTPGTILGDAERDVNTALNKGNAGNLRIKVDDVVKPLEDQIAKSRLVKTKTGKAYADALQEELDTFRAEHPSGELSVQDAHNEKRAIYSSLSDRTWSDTSTAVPGAGKIAAESLARGLKDSINDQIPEIAGLNNRMHASITLQDALTDAEKSNPSMFRNGITTALAGLGLEHILRGGSMASAIPAIAWYAMSNPAIASRLALSLRYAPYVGAITGAIARGGAVAGQASAPLNPNGGLLYSPRRDGSIQ